MIFRPSLVFAFVFVISSIDFTYSQYNGEPCQLDGAQGICAPLRKCRSAIRDLQKGKRPQNCTFEGNNPVVCCVTSDTSESVSSCPPIPSNATRISKTGQKSLDKCIDWLEYIYPCASSAALFSNGPKTRQDQCSHSVATLIVGGTVAKNNEFPHMALLGFDNAATGTIAWLCGGSLISERWVLTAGHCLYARETDSDVKHVRLGSDDVETTTNPELTHTIERTVPHPEYKGLSIYNDIALLKLDRNAKLSKAVIPACLHVGNPVNDRKFLASGWGAVSSGGSTSKKLLKVTLEKFEFSECSPKNPPTKKSPQGVRNDIQLCAGHHREVKDTCQGDSGGPLQIYNLDVYCTYTLMGVTSTGKGCGTPGQPALYTRVSAYVPWIESVVWP